MSILSFPFLSLYLSAGMPLLLNGTKIRALLDAADAGGITLSYEEKQAVEGKKRKQLVKVVKRYAFSEVKYTKEYLDFK